MFMRDGYHPGTRGSALVLVEDRRAALAAVLLLQEMGFSVDIAAQPESALAWVRLARYEWVVCSGGELTTDHGFLARLRNAAPVARILVIGADAAPALAACGIEMLPPPVDVNMLMDRFAERAA